MKHLVPRPVLALLALVLALATGACASTSGARGESAGSGQGVAIQVENDNTPSSDLTVYMVTQSGNRQILGSVPPNRTVTLNYDGPVGGGQFRLLARPNGGRDIVSNPFALGGVTRMRWSLQSNIAVPVD